LAQFIKNDTSNLDNNSHFPTRPYISLGTRGFPRFAFCEKWIAQSS